MSESRGSALAASDQPYSGFAVSGYLEVLGCRAARAAFDSATCNTRSSAHRDRSCTGMDGYSPRIASVTPSVVLLYMVAAISVNDDIWKW